MRFWSSRLAILVMLFVSFPAWSQSIIQPAPAPPQTATIPVQPDPPGGSPADPQKSGGDFSNVGQPNPKDIVPKDAIIVKGAWSSASDSLTPIPESATLANNLFTDAYFGISWPLPADWRQQYLPPPPSESGRYILAQLTRPDTYKGDARGSIQFNAYDMFFTPVPAANALQFANYSKDHLPEYYQLELKPTQTAIGGRPFTFFAYGSSVAQLHWYVLATQIRCHTVEVVLMNRDPQTLEALVREMDGKMKLAPEAGETGGAGGGGVPVCIKDYASGENVMERVEPVLTLNRYNSIPVRIIIDKQGKVKHIHFLSAFPDQERSITEALKQWRFRPYQRDGKRMEVETGIMFGRPPVRMATETKATTE